MNEYFKFYMPTKVCFGVGIAAEITEYVEGKNVLIVCDPFLYQSGAAKKIGDRLEGRHVAYFSEIEPNPCCESVDKAANAARQIKADCIIGMGGGSALDVSKITACLVTNEGSIYDYYAGGKRVLGERKAALICIPTTAGTGSEVTNVGVFTNQQTGIKMPFVTDAFWADYAVIDPELTYTLPPAVTAATGMDAFCHAIEAYWNKESQPMCDMLAMEAMRLILNHIKTAYDEPCNAEARSAMLQASLMAGVAFSQTRTTGIHAISFPLTSEFGASHGIACAITLPAFMKLSCEQRADKMKRLTAYLGYDCVESFAAAIERLMESMNMPVRLRQIGVKSSDLEHIAKVGLEASIIQLTPAVMNEETVCRLLKSIL
ncbi:MAG: iron-containing alcohol dehydrogenase family protein [Firmicutes bacterium]|nr:iron-containing alcohol dehydrogenase family protein [Bacillota bacterium]